MMSCVDGTLCEQIFQLLSDLLTSWPFWAAAAAIIAMLLFREPIREALKGDILRETLRRIRKIIFPGGGAIILDEFPKTPIEKPHQSSGE